MPVQLSVTVSNGEAIRRDLDELMSEDAPASGALAIKAQLESARTKLAQAPGGVTPSPFYQPNGPNAWVSDKQRRYVMMAIRRGIITVPYKRGGNYQKEWRVRAVTLKRGTGYQLYNPQKYAKWVGGSAYGTNQARIHQGRWATLRDAVEEAVSQLPKEIADDIVMVARRRGYQAQ